MGYNVFDDMEMPDPETELAKAEIVSQLRALLTEKNLQGPPPPNNGVFLKPR